jgi:hypothetical protein
MICGSRGARRTFFEARHNALQMPQTWQYVPGVIGLRF